MNRDELINMVKLRMDEVSPFDEDEMVSSPIVEAMLVEAANNIALMFPDHLFSSTRVSVQVVSNPDGSGYINVPDDMLKFVRLKMSEWERPVTKLIPSSDPSYLLQSDKHIRGGASRPLAFISTKGNGRVIEYFSVPEGKAHTATDFVYIEKKDPENIPDNLVNALTWEAAKLVFMSMQDANSASICVNNVNQQLQMFQQ